MKKVLLLLTLLPLLVNGQMINTIAGNGSSITSGDGGPATAAGIYGPNGLVYDNLGNLYVTEYYSNIIRKITPSGVITTIAGTGIAGYSGDGGPATNAKLSQPVKIAVDASNNLYVADLNNNCIRKITTTGIITTVAGNGAIGYSGDGGPATAAKLYHPSGVSLDASGNIYIADYSNSVIRKVTTGGIISTIAGTGTAGSSGDGGPATAAMLNQPWGANMDALGNLYVLDMMNNKVRKITPSGVISTFAGTGTGGFSGDGGPASAAQFTQPSSITFDGVGNIYVADQLNYRIRKISSSGIITTIVGTGVAGYSGDGGPATTAQIDQSNDIIYTSSGLTLTDNNNNRVRKLIPITTSVELVECSLQINLYPNPAYTEYTIDLSEQGKSITVELINELGQIISKTEGVKNGQKFSLSDLPSSTYTVRVHYNGQMFYKKIIKTD